MITFRIKETEEYEKLVPFFIENELEYTEEDAVETPTDVLKCWEIVEGPDFETGRTIGGFVLAKRDGEYICDGIAIDKEYRKFNLGTELLNKGIEEVLKRGGRSMYLVARAPEFFRKYGFVTVGRDEAPNFFECTTCPQYGNGCNPEVMKFNM